MYHKGRLYKLISLIVVSVIALGGLPSKVMADVFNAPSYYSVQPNLSYEITTNITSSWINHESIDFVLTNTGSETIHNWYLTFNTPYCIDNIWNGALYETNGNGTYTITSNGWNQDIHAGESVTVGITFSSDMEENLSVDPEWYLLNTQATVVDASQYTLEYTEYSAWETGFTGQLTLTPQVDCQHWELSFGSNREITSVSSALLISEGENNYAITHDENNMRLFAGNAYNFGIQGVNTEDPLEFSNVELTVVDLAYHLTDDEDANGVPDYLEFIGGSIVIEPTPTPTPVPTDVPTETPTTEPTGTETPTPTEEPTPTPIIDYESDQDLDGLPDYIEDQLGTDPLKADTDDDLLTDYIEVMIGYDPTNPDTDNNGVTDGNEDCDNDGLSNAYELNLGTNPVMEDTDSDRLNDGDEVNVYGTDPLVPDSDGDGICDGDEVSMGKDPSDPTDGATRISQSLTQEINNAEDPAITSVTVTADLAGKIDRVLDIRDYYNIDVYSTDVYGRIGSPINFECDEEFDLATIVIHYDETQLINTPENSLGVLWYDEENNIYELQEQAVVDTANNQITLEVEHFSTYVLVNTTMWFNPVRPNYYGYFYYPNSIVQMDDVQGSYTLQTYEDIAWADFQAEHGENFVRVNTVYSYDYHMSGNHYYLYEWLAIDTTDSDEDGALDFMETLGVLASNHHTYYSDVGNPDSDGDTLPDGVELGNIYLLGKFTDNNYLEKYRRDVDGTITPCQDFHKFDFFRSILFSRSVAAVACIHSDPMMQDSDGDLDCDLIDPHPTRRILNDQLLDYISRLEVAAISYDTTNPSLMVCSFIRSFNENYDSSMWNVTGGHINYGFNYYVRDNYMDLYSYFSEVDAYYADYDGNRGDLRHLAATLTGLIYKSIFFSGSQIDLPSFGYMTEEMIDDLSGWAGDYHQIIRNRFVSVSSICSDYSSMYNFAYEAFFSEDTEYSMGDLYADVDAVIIDDLYGNLDSLSDTFEYYYSQAVERRFTLFGICVDYEDRAYTYSRAKVYGLVTWPLFDDYDVELLSDNQWLAIYDAFVDKIHYLIEVEQYE